MNRILLQFITRKNPVCGLCVEAQHVLHKVLNNPVLKSNQKQIQLETVKSNLIYFYLKLLKIF